MMLLVAPRVFRAPSGPPAPSTPVGPGRYKQPGQAPPPTGTEAKPSAPSTPAVLGALLWLAPSLTCIRYKVHPARLRTDDSGIKFALHTQNVPNKEISSEQGEFCTANPARRGLQGEFYTAVARRGSCWASLVSSQHRPCHQLPAFRRPLHRGAVRPGNRHRSRRPHSTFRTGGDGGFAALGGGWRRVAGVSHP